MKKYKHFIVLIGLLLTVGCKETPPTSDSTKTPVYPSVREAYASQFSQNDSLFNRWTNAYARAQKDSVRVTLPYAESGIFMNDRIVAYSYTIQLRAGENLIILAEKQPDTALVFIDLFRKNEDTNNSYSLIHSAKTGAQLMSYKTDAYGFYKVIVQPALGQQIPFQLKMYTQPMYDFPVSGAGNKDILSFWAANRGEGKRSHEGIDIFAKKGTPVIAIVNGTVLETADRGKGGKQVWVKDSVLGTSIYHAHLDAINVKTGASVQVGDTLGFVGNTGNADTTEPHLHFGIYLGETGAVDPYPYIKQTEIPEISPYNNLHHTMVISSEATIRQGPSAALSKIATLKKNDTVSILGQHGSWFHVVSKDTLRGFVQQSLLERLPSN